VDFQHKQSHDDGKYAVAECLNPNTENPSASPFFWITPDFLADSRLPVHFAPAESP
jgi:hypothetical protein